MENNHIWVHIVDKKFFYVIIILIGLVLIMSTFDDDQESEKSLTENTNENNVDSTSVGFSCEQGEDSLTCSWSNCESDDRMITLNHESDIRLYLLDEPSGETTFENLDGHYLPLMICGEDNLIINEFFF